MVAPRPVAQVEVARGWIVGAGDAALALIAQGLSNQEIADRAYISINSVKTYIRTAYRKMGVTTRSQAVLWGVRNGYLAEFPDDDTAAMTG